MKIPMAFWFLISLVVFGIQLMYLNKLEINSISPDWLLLVVLFASLYLPIGQSSVVNWFTGLLKDVGSVAGFGTYGLLFVVTGLVISLFKAILFKDDLKAQLVIAFIGVFFCQFLYGLGMLMTYGTISFYLVIIKSFLISIASVLIVTIISLIQFRIRQLFLKREVEELRDLIKEHQPIPNQ
jgi:rod shape-determining protein MreD